MLALGEWSDLESLSYLWRGTDITGYFWCDGCRFRRLGAIRALFLYPVPSRYRALSWL